MKLQAAGMALAVGISAAAGVAAPAMAQQAGGPPARAQEPAYRTTFVRLAGGVPGVLYEPAHPGAKAEIGVFVMHMAADYLEFSACTELSRRGYRVLHADGMVAMDTPPRGVTGRRPDFT